VPLALLRALVLISALLLTCCAGAAPPQPASFPPAPLWKTLLGEFVVPPLAGAGHRLFVATRDGEVRALDERTGSQLWKVVDLPGSLAAAEGALLVRSPQGRVTSLQPRTGATRWSVETGIAGSLPVVFDEDRVLVAGAGLAALDLASGRVLFTEHSGAEVTAAPVSLPFMDKLLTVEADGALRLRERASGTPVWTQASSRPALAPPLVDRARKVVYLGTTEKRIVQVRLADGHVGWRWTVGADVAYPGLLLHDKVLFASYDAVLYALQPGGSLAWRTPLPSRPLSGPLVAGHYLIVACLEDVIVVITPDTGHRVGSLHTSAEIRTPPLVVDDLVLIGLRDRSIVAYGLPATSHAPAHPGHHPGAPQDGKAPASAPPASVVPPEGDR
jgi:outer membrane protein assembly factor BamB